MRWFEKLKCLKLKRKCFTAVNSVPKTHCRFAQLLPIFHGNATSGEYLGRTTRNKMFGNWLVLVRNDVYLINTDWCSSNGRQKAWNSKQTSSGDVRTVSELPGFQRLVE